MKEPHLILGIGELLWDILPEGMRLGGAPANFSVMAGRLGNHAAILSRIGRDELGRQAIDRLDPMPVETSFLEVDAAHETGRVTVSFSDGEPHYTIHQPAAWDFLELSDEWIQLAERADALCFGSLAQRSLQSRQTIQTLARAKLRILHSHLRCELARAVLLCRGARGVARTGHGGQDERGRGAAGAGICWTWPSDEESAGDGPAPEAELLRTAAERLLQEFPTLQLVAITRGSRGSLLVNRDEWDEHPGFPVKVADGIGAGDAFTAAIAHYLLRGADLATLNEAGNRWGGWMASQSGAMPALPDAVRDAIAAAIERTD